MNPPPPITLSLLGELRLTIQGDGGASYVLHQPKRTALLSYLTLESAGEFVRRDRIVAMFWPESDRSRARGSLRQALRFLRSELGSARIENRGREEIRVHPDRLVCDALDFRRRIAAGDPAGALDLYRGPLLDGFHLEGCREFEEWLEKRRGELAGAASQLAWTVAEDARDNCDRESAAFWGKRALSLSPFEESGARRLIELLIEVGDEGEALRVFQGLRERLIHDFGVDVSPATLRLARDLLPEPDGEGAAAGGSGRRSGGDRRTRARRKRSGAGRLGVDRRSGGERRWDERRSGSDRRQ